MQYSRRARSSARTAKPSIWACSGNQTVWYIARIIYISAQSYLCDTISLCPSWVSRLRTVGSVLGCSRQVLNKEALYPRETPTRRVEGGIGMPSARHPPHVGIYSVLLPPQTISRGVYHDPHNHQVGSQGPKMKFLSIVSNHTHTQGHASLGMLECLPGLGGAPMAISESLEDFYFWALGPHLDPPWLVGVLVNASGDGLVGQ